MQENQIEGQIKNITDTLEKCDRMALNCILTADMSKCLDDIKYVLESVRIDYIYMLESLKALEMEVKHHETKWKNSW